MNFILIFHYLINVVYKRIEKQGLRFSVFIFSLISSIALAYFVKSVGLPILTLDSLFMPVNFVFATVSPSRAEIYFIGFLFIHPLISNEKASFQNIIISLGFILFVLGGHLGGIILFLILLAGTKFRLLEGIHFLSLLGLMVINYTSESIAHNFNDLWILVATFVLWGGAVATFIFADTDSARDIYIGASLSLLFVGYMGESGRIAYLDTAAMSVLVLCAVYGIRQRRIAVIKKCILIFMGITLGLSRDISTLQIVSFTLFTAVFYCCNNHRDFFAIPKDNVKFILVEVVFALTLAGFLYYFADQYNFISWLIVLLIVGNYRKIKRMLSLAASQLGEGACITCMLVILIQILAVFEPGKITWKSIFLT